MPELFEYSKTLEHTIAMRKKKEMIFGIHAIHEALQSGEQSIAKIWFKRTMKNNTLRQLLTLANQNSIPCSPVPLVKLNKLTNSNHQGAIALISPIRFVPLDHIIQTAYEKGKAPCLVVLDHIQDTRNFGAIARSALAAGIDALVVNIQESLPITGDAIKTSAGALCNLPVCRTRHLLNTLDFLQHSGLQLVACTEKGQQTLYDIDMQQPTAFVFGGEHKGIAPKHIQRCDVHMRIPMLNNVNSLNISVATSIVLYERLRQHSTS